jgi:glutamate--cysteine ligase
LTNFAARLDRLAKNPDLFKEYGRGVERETLRYSNDAQLSMAPHPKSLGSALTNEWITTDFSESLLEFITPVSHDIDTLLNQLSDVHHYTQSNLDFGEKLWPMSMPCYVADENDIALAHYGSSNAGRMKTLYREGLKHRYGSLMQIISGVHFNFSFPESFWDQLFGEQSEPQRQDSKSEAYFGLIRNYYRFGWLIPFFFGASPALCSSFVNGRETHLKFENIDGTLYLPHATSLRLSDLGYTNSEQSDLKISFNSLNEYLEGLNRAIRTPSEKFAKLGINENGEQIQLNTNVLQIENELYAPIRPKRVAKSGEKPSEALGRGGVEYIEVRALDVNPFSSIGISKQQILFLDLFLTWAVLSESDPMDNCELNCWSHNWNSVIERGRKTDLLLKIGCHGEELTLKKWAERIFGDFELLAKKMDAANGDTQYQDVCEELLSWVDDPEKTISGRLLKEITTRGGITAVGNHFGELYAEQHVTSSYRYYTEEMMKAEVEQSFAKQKAIEESDDVEFNQYLNEYFAYLNE